MQRDGLDGGSRETSVTALAADARRNSERIEIDAGDGIERVDQREGIGFGCHRGVGGIMMLVMLGVSLTMTGMRQTSVTQRVICSQYSGTWPTAEPMPRSLMPCGQP